MGKETRREIKTGKTVVFGATGLVGSHLTAQLLLEGCQDVVLPLRSRKHLPRLEKVLQYHGISPRPLQIIETSYYTPKTFLPFLEGATAVFHCAGILSDRSGATQRMVAENVAITRAIASACLQAQTGRLVHVSSVAALGSSDLGKPVDETCDFQSLSGRSAYSVSKFYSENEVWRAHANGLDVSIANPSVILGYGDWHTRNTPRLFRMIYQGLPFVPEGESGYVSADDVARALIVLATEGEQVSGQRFILSNEQLSYRALFNDIAASLHVSPPRWMVKGGTLRGAARIAGILERMGLHPAISRELLETTSQHLVYDGRRITEQTSFRYSVLKEDIARMGQQFLADFKAFR